MFYSHFDAQDQHKAAAEYVGLVRFNGAVGGKSGSFVMQDTGSFEQGTASSALQIVEHSGTGELKGIKGKGSYQANKEGFRFEVDYRSVNCRWQIADCRLKDDVRLGIYTNLQSSIFNLQSHPQLPAVTGIFTLVVSHSNTRNPGSDVTVNSSTGVFSASGFTLPRPSSWALTASV